MPIGSGPDEVRNVTQSRPTCPLGEPRAIIWPTIWAARWCGMKSPVVSLSAISSPAGLAAANLAISGQSSTVVGTDRTTAIAVDASDPGRCEHTKGKDMSDTTSIAGEGHE